MVMNSLDDLLSAGINHAKKEGYGDVELCYQAEESVDIKSFEGDIDSLESSSSAGLAVRVIKDGRCGYSYSEALTWEALAQALKEAHSHCRINPQEAGNKLKAPGEAHPGLHLFNEELASIAVERKIAIAKQLEHEARSYDGRIVNVPWAFYGDGSILVRIKNSLGLDVSYKANGAGLAVEAMAKEGHLVETYSKSTYSKNFKGLDPKRLALETSQECISRLRAEETKSGGYKIVFDNQPARSILGAFSGIFSAKNVQKGLSLLAGKLDGQVASPCVTIIDDGMLPEGYASRPFDAEGTPSRGAAVIKEGALCSFLHNLATAAKDGVASTGNASRPSIKSPLDLAPSNFYLVGGVYDRSKLLEIASSGVLIMELEGLHSGANSISGDFSLSAHGYEFSGGKILRPVHNFTVAGNFFELLKGIESVGSDLTFSSPSSGGTSIGSPSFLVGRLSVGGI